MIYSHRGSPVLNGVLFVSMWCHLQRWLQHPSLGSALTPKLDGIDSQERNDFSCYCCWIFFFKSDLQYKWILLSSKWWPWDRCNPLMFPLMLLLPQTFLESFFVSYLHGIFLGIFSSLTNIYSLLEALIFGKREESALSPAAEVGDEAGECWSCPRQWRILDVF